MRKTKMIYMAPSVEVCNVFVEFGFAVTGSTIEPLGGRNDELTWE